MRWPKRLNHGPLVGQRRAFEIVDLRLALVTLDDCVDGLFEVLVALRLSTHEGFRIRRRKGNRAESTLGARGGHRVARVYTMPRPRKLRRPPNSFETMRHETDGCAPCELRAQPQRGLKIDAPLSRAGSSPASHWPMATPWGDLWFGSCLSTTTTRSTRTIDGGLGASPAPDGRLQELRATVFGTRPAAPPKPESSEFSLVHAYQGGEALDIVQRDAAQGLRFAVAFVDMRMPPGWNGIETVRQLRAVDPQLSFVVCTAYSDFTWEAVLDAVGDGAGVHLLRKPFQGAQVRRFAEVLAHKWRLVERAKRRGLRETG